tara:strand:+ start:358 stop:696 length:339 start_codon:yes stop_codon:yes gene_type:complete
MLGEWPSVSAAAFVFTIVLFTRVLIRTLPVICGHQTPRRKTVAIYDEIVVRSETEALVSGVVVGMVGATLLVALNDGSWRWSLMEVVPFVTALATVAIVIFKGTLDHIVTCE